MHWTPLPPPQKLSPVLISVKGRQHQAHSVAKRIKQTKNPNDPIGNWTHNILAYSAVAQPTAPVRTPNFVYLQM